MNGNSRAHQQSPSSGTQKSSFFRKNLSIGIRRLNSHCTITMSTHDRWLQVTRYQPSRRRPAGSVTSQRIRPPASRPATLVPIHCSAIHDAASRHARTRGGHGTNSRTTAAARRKGDQNSVFRTNATNESAPTIGAGIQPPIRMPRAKPTGGYSSRCTEDGENAGTHTATYSAPPGAGVL